MTAFGNREKQPAQPGCFAPVTDCVKKETSWIWVNRRYLAVFITGYCRARSSMTYDTMQLHVERWHVYLFSSFSTATFDIFLWPWHSPLSIAMMIKSFGFLYQHPGAFYRIFPTTKGPMSSIHHFAAFNRILLFFLSNFRNYLIKPLLNYLNY